MSAIQNITSSTDALDSLVRVSAMLKAVGALSPAVRRELDALADWIDQPEPGAYEAEALIEKLRRDWRERQGVVA